MTTENQVAEDVVSSTETTNEVVEETANEPESDSTSGVEPTAEAMEGQEFPELSEADLIALLDEALKTDDQAEPENNGPSIDPDMLKQIEDKKAQDLADAEAEKNNQLLFELEDLRQKDAEYQTKEADFIAQLEAITADKNQIEEYNKEYEEFLTKVLETPILGEFVIAIQQGKTVDIPKWLKELSEANRNALSVSPTTDVVQDAPKAEINKADYIANLIGKSNKNKL